MAPIITLPAPGKLNLFLHVTGRRPDGYHCLQTIFQFIDLSDRLTFARRNDGLIVLQGDQSGVAAEQNLIVRAAKALQQATGSRWGATITCEKNLPIGGGIGGGSSDAATTLIGLNDLWDCDLEQGALLRLGLGLGADVPIFIYGQAAWAEGVGEVFTPVSPTEPYYLLIKPPVSVATAKIFTASGLTRDTSPIRIAAYSPQTTRNDLQATVCDLYPEVEKAIQWLSQFANARMTGSGSVVFAAFESCAAAEAVASKAPDNYHTFVCKGCNLSPLQAELAAFQV